NAVSFSEFGPGTNHGRTAGWASRLQRGGGDGPVAPASLAVRCRPAFVLLGFIISSAPRATALGRYSPWKNPNKRSLHEKATCGMAGGGFGGPGRPCPPGPRQPSLPAEF